MTHWPVPDPIGFLIGEWALSREMSDLDSSAQGQFAGTVRFTADGDGLLQAERGQMSWPSHSGPAGRTLRYARTATPGVLEVRFADGRPFHPLDLRSGRWTAAHRCGADDYAGEFSVASPDAWSYRWRVRGPAKDLVLTSVLRRTAG